MTHNLKLYQMHSNHNHIIVVDARTNNCTQYVSSLPNSITSKCDQLMWIQNSNEADCKALIYNRDGSEVSMCANGLRCVSKLLTEEKAKDIITIEVSDVIYKTKRLADGTISVNIGKPLLSWKDIPLARAMKTPELDYSCGCFTNPIVLNVGNPHIVFFVENMLLDEINLDEVGPRIENNPLFPERINVSFAKVLDEHNIVARTWERGAGETKSCGSAASSIGWAAVYRKYTQSPCNVFFAPDRKITVHVLSDGSIESCADAHVIHEYIST